MLPPLIFLVLYRFAFAERCSVHLTNLSLAALHGILPTMLGIGPVAEVLLVVIVPAASSVSGCFHYNIISTTLTRRDTAVGPG